MDMPPSKKRTRMPTDRYTPPVFAKRRCRNREFIPRLTELTVHDEMEFGLKARKDIEANTCIAFYPGADNLLTREEVERRKAAGEDMSYMLMNSQELFLDGKVGRAAAFSRYSEERGCLANHECQNYNCAFLDSLDGSGGMDMVTLREIKKGEALTVNYGDEYKMKQLKGKCLCSTCVKAV